MAFFDLVVRQQKSPTDAKAILDALHGLAKRLKKGAHYETAGNRVRNINLTKGLIQGYFAARVPPAFGHGPSLVLDFENAVRRSRIESPRYEFKQGVLRLEAERKLDTGVLERLVQTACSIANVGPDSDGNLFMALRRNLTGSQPDGLSACGVFRLHSAV
jgi:hypothetical protein